MGRRPCCSKEGLNRGAWTASEDRKLTDYINLHGEGKWRSLPQRAGLKRCGKSCRLRWLNYLRPDIKRGNISPDEEELIMRLHKLLGNRWSLIAGRLPGRTDNEIKNYWNTNLGKKVHNSSQKIRIDDEKNKKYNNSSNVIRTKAMKCSRVIFHPQPHQIGPIDHDKVVRKKSEAKEISIHNSLELSFIPEEHNSMELIVNADNTRDVCLSDLLNCDFTGLLDGINDSAIDLSRPSSDGSLIFSKDLMEHWADQNYNFLHQNVVSNHEGFASFIEPDADWLA